MARLKQLRKLPSAERDLIECAEWIAIGSKQAADRFIDAAMETIWMLRSSPYLGRPAGFTDSRVADLRIVTIRRMRHYLILYRIKSDTVEIVRVTHGSRDLAALFTPHSR